MIEQMKKLTLILAVAVMIAAFDSGDRYILNEDPVTVFASGTDGDLAWTLADDDALTIISITAEMSR